MNNTPDGVDKNQEVTFQAIEGFSGQVREGGEGAIKELLIQLDAMNSLLDKDDTETAREYINRLLEDCFRESDTYLHALTLYRNTYDLIGGRDPNELLRDLIERFVPKPDRKTTGQPSGQSLEPVIAATDWITTHSRTEAQRAKFAPIIERIRKLQNKADSESRQEGSDA